MTYSKRQWIGKMNVNQGKLFEQAFEMGCVAAGIECTRIPDGCRVQGANRLIRVTSPFDWILSYQGKAAIIDTKTVSGDRFNCSDVTRHQVVAMLGHHANGIFAGYVIEFREVHDVCFFSAKVLYEKGKGSFKPDDGVSLVKKGNEPGPWFKPTRIFIP